MSAAIPLKSVIDWKCETWCEIDGEEIDGAADVVSVVPELAGDKVNKV